MEDSYSQMTSRSALMWQSDANEKWVHAAQTASEMTFDLLRLIFIKNVQKVHPCSEVWEYFRASL